MTPEQAFVFERPSFVAEDTLPNGRRLGLMAPAGVVWSVNLSLNVGLE